MNEHTDHSEQLVDSSEPPDIAAVQSDDQFQNN